MLDYKSSAEQILDLVGGKTNITQFAHCSTRLRFTLKDNSKANLDALKKVPGVMGVVLKGQLQVIIGNNVVEMYEALQKAGQLEGAGTVPDDDAPAPKKKVSDLVLDFVISTFQPLIGVITVGGLIKTLLTLLTMAGWMDKSSDLYQVMFNIADATFYFLPVMIAYTSATKLKCNKMYAVIIAAVPLLPKLSGLIGDGLTIFGLTVPNVSYTSQIFPAILSVFVLYFVEKYFTKICPKPVRVTFVPVVCFLEVVPLELLFLGPLGYNAGVAFTSCLLALYGSVGWVVVAVFSAVFFFMQAEGKLATVLPGKPAVCMHTALLPYITAIYVDPGYDMLNAPAKTAHNISECGACFAVALKSKNPDTKSVALSAAISALFGISEPALYGVTLQNKRAMVGVVTGSFISALVMGIVGVKSFTLMSSCLIGMPQFVDEANPANFIWACVGFAIAIGVSFVVTMVLYRDEELKEVSEAQKAVLREMGM